MSGNIDGLRGERRRLSLQILEDRRGEVSSPLRGCSSLPSGVFLGEGCEKGKEQRRKKSRPKIFRKAWDRVKGIIHSPSRDGVGGRRGGDGCSSGGGEVLFGEACSVGGDDERDRIARNYALLQKRLSQEFRQTSLKGRGGALRGEFSDEFKRKLFEWESHPSRKRKGEKDDGISSRHLKELAWLDKQLEKIEAEKRRLEEELRKQVEREIRVQKMKEAIRCSLNDRVYNIRTESEVKLRVEGITSEYAINYPKFFVDEDREDVVDAKVGEEEEEVIGPLDLINERLKESEGQGDALGEKAALLLAECVALGEVASGGCSGGGGDVDGRISSTASSCCCSAEYEHTDSFATKNNSGASNTDSEVYDKRCTITRRRSSDCGSTSDRGSPQLSAFTSEEDEEVKEDVKTEDSVGGKGKAESVVPLCVKQIVIDEESGFGGGSNVFVPTKRTIFSPVVDDGGCEARVVGVVPKIGYKPQPKTQLHRVFPGSAGVEQSRQFPFCSPMSSRRGLQDVVDFNVLRDRGIGRGCGRKLPPRTNVHVPRKYTIGGGIPPALWRGCIIARSSSFTGNKDRRDSGVENCGGEDSVGFGVSKSKSTGSIKRSIASVKCFLGFGKSGSGSVDGEAQGLHERCERRGSKSGFARRFGSFWRKDGE